MDDIFSMSSTIFRAFMNGSGSCYLSPKLGWRGEISAISEDKCLLKRP